MKRKSLLLLICINIFALVAILILFFVYYVANKRNKQLETSLAVVRDTHITNWDNGATTPSFSYLIESVPDLAKQYGSVHRGTGASATFASEQYERAKRTILELLGCDTDKYTCIITKNTTDSSNMIARLVDTGKILISEGNHHSAILPFLTEHNSHNVHFVAMDPKGQEIDVVEMNRQITALQPYLVVLTHVSNVTGVVNKIAEIGKVAHENNALVLLDCAQSIAHTDVDIEKLHVDFLIFSSHKMYSSISPVGILIGPISFFKTRKPISPGGGNVSLVTKQNILWLDDVSRRHECGTPPLIGAIHAAKALKTIKHKMETIKAHDCRIRKSLIRNLSTIPGMNIINNCSSGRKHTGTVLFEIEDFDSDLLAHILSRDYNIACRSGCFCAHITMEALCANSVGQNAKRIQFLESGDISHGQPSFVRLTVAPYNTIADVNKTAFAIRQIVQRGSDFYPPNYSFSVV